MPIAKARAMTKGQRAGAVKRKQAKANTGPTPSRAATFAKRTKKSDQQMVKMPWLDQAQKNYIGSYVSGDLGGVQVGNKSYKNIILTLVLGCQKYHDKIKINKC